MELLHIRAGAFLPLIFKRSVTKTGNRLTPDLLVIHRQLMAIACSFCFYLFLWPFLLFKSVSYRFKGDELMVKSDELMV